mmetsp:Transcript_4792/g.7248  ORF Transcript_4792/g.7248 Transcript_4792/m.7248 type:complete len:288 (+) Transcript_4792:268-1131(+)
MVGDLKFLTEKAVEKFEEEGFLVIENFWGSEKVSEAKNSISEVIKFSDLNESQTIFSTKQSKQANDEYFLTSGDKVRIFWEETAFENDFVNTNDKSKLINKIGHAIHDLVPSFEKLSYDTKIGDICKDLGMKKPLISQSMYIFKQPKIGSEVRPHQDGTFLYTEPQSVIGFWWALDDCREENGCLWVVKGSHKEGVKQRFKRCGDVNSGCEFVPKENIVWDISAAEKLAVSAGTLVILHNAVVHFSKHNASSKSRHAYSIHVTDGADGVEYLSDNWLQREDGFHPIE